MKNQNLLVVAALFAGLLQGCSGRHGGAMSDSTAPEGDTNQTRSLVKTADASANALPDTEFASKAAVSGLAEVALGKMAAARGASKAIKNFGNMMVMDHGKANDELKAIAQKKNIPLPAVMDAEHQAKSDSLSKLSGKDFDNAYAQMMIEGHKKTLILMQGEAAGGKDADLKAFAAKTAPIVEHHLDQIKRIQIIKP